MTPLESRQEIVARRGASRVRQRVGRACIFALSMAMWPIMANSTDLGKVGPTYPIAETDMLKLIEERLREKEKSGELAKLQEEAVKRSINSIENPKPVAGLGKSTKTRTFYHDPSITAQSNITDATGKIIVAAGTRINPLDYVSMTRHLLFFDGRDKSQVKLAEKLILHYQGKIKPILTGGSYTELMRQWKTQVYYDQGGALVRKLGIERVPALVSQEERRLRVDEII